jgi:hypothetical protein
VHSNGPWRGHTTSQDSTYPHGSMKRPRQASTPEQVSSVTSLVDCSRVDYARREKLILNSVSIFKARSNLGYLELAEPTYSDLSALW